MIMIARATSHPVEDLLIDPAIAKNAFPIFFIYNNIPAVRTFSYTRGSTELSRF